MKTTWQEIKERVELKIGEEVAMREFTILANEVISDLQEVAMVKAPVVHYSERMIMTEDEEFYFDKEDFKHVSRTVDHSQINLSLPFNYHPGYNELELIYGKDSDPRITVKEDLFSSESSIVSIVNDKGFNEFLTSSGDIVYTIRRKTMTISDKYNCMNELVIIKPNNLLIPIDLQIIDSNGDMYEAELTTSTNPVDKEYRYGTKTNSAYYIENDKIHIFTEAEKVNNIRFSYFKTMDKLEKEIDPSYQIVELEPGFENLMTLGICHKWLENFVGTEDEETQTMFKKYLTLKQEYESTAKQRKIKRRQTRIIAAY